MRTILTTMILLTSTIGFAKPMSLEVNVPPGAKNAYVKIKNIEADACNKYGLEIEQSFNGKQGHFSLIPTATTDYCQSSEKKSISLWKSLNLKAGYGAMKTITVHFDSEDASDLKVTF